MPPAFTRAGALYCQCNMSLHNMSTLWTEERVDTGAGEVPGAL